MADIRLVEKGTFTFIPKDSLYLAPSDDGSERVCSPRAWGKYWSPEAVCFALLDADHRGLYDLKRLGTMVQKALDTLPDLGYKVVLTYRQDRFLFDACFVVTTVNSEDLHYLVIGNLGSIIATGLSPGETAML